MQSEVRVLMGRDPPPLKAVYDLKSGSIGAGLDGRVLSKALQISYRLGLARTPVALLDESPNAAVLIDYYCLKSARRCGPLRKQPQLRHRESRPMALQECIDKQEAAP